MITVGVPRETFLGETWIALAPQRVPVSQGAGLEIVVEAGAGDAAGVSGGGLRGSRSLDREPG